MLEPKRNKTVKRITVKIDGLTTPSWSPDGKQLVFTGYVGGFSDLFIVNADGSGLKRLTNDRYADLHPAWSPDGKSIAFTTDRGPGTNFEAAERRELPHRPVRPRHRRRRGCSITWTTARTSTLPGRPTGSRWCSCRTAAA